MQETFVQNVTHMNSTLSTLTPLRVTHWHAVLNGLDYTSVHQKMTLTELHPSDAFCPKLLCYNLRAAISSRLLQQHFHPAARPHVETMAVSRKERSKQKKKGRLAGSKSGSVTGLCSDGNGYGKHLPHPPAARWVPPHSLQIAHEISSLLPASPNKCKGKACMLLMALLGTPDQGTASF